MDTTQIKEEYVIKNLYREAKIMSKLSHPCIAALFQTMQHGSVYYIVTELVGGGDLCTFIKAQKSGKLEEKVARVYGRQLVSAISHMHRMGIVHRDLKMENIMLTLIQTQIKIVDFGLSNFFCDENPLRTKCGSPEYAAPELFVEGKEYGPEVDLWSLGVILYGMVVGQLPFVSSRDNHCTSQERRKKLLEQINRGLAATQRRALTGFSQEFRASLMPRLLVADSAKRISIGELLFHPWITAKGRRSIRTNPIRDVDEKIKNAICEQISQVLNMDIQDIQRAVRGDPQGNIAGMFNMLSYKHKLKMAEGDIVTRPMGLDHTKIISTAAYTTPRPKTVKVMSSDSSRISAAAKLFENTVKSMHPLRKEVMKSAPTNKVTKMCLSETTRASDKNTDTGKTKQLVKSRQQCAVDAIIKHSQKKISGRPSAGDAHKYASGIPMSRESSLNGVVRPQSALQQVAGNRPTTPTSARKFFNKKVAPLSARSSHSSRLQTSDRLENPVCDKLRYLSSKESNFMQKLKQLETEVSARLSNSARPSTSPPQPTTDRIHKRKSLLPVASASPQRPVYQNVPSRVSSGIVPAKPLNTTRSTINSASSGHGVRYDLRQRSAPQTKKPNDKELLTVYEKRKLSGYPEGDRRNVPSEKDLRKSHTAIKDLCDFAKKTILQQRPASIKKSALKLPHPMENPILNRLRPH